MAGGEFVAFFDSDDVWQNDFLKKLAEGLREAPNVDWAYCACCIVDFNTGKVIAPNTFYDAGRPRPFLRLPAYSFGFLQVFDPQKLLPRLFRTQAALFCGLQNSLIRMSVFSCRRFRTHFRNEAEDVPVCYRAIRAGHGLAYVNRVLVRYHVHGNNTSAASLDSSFDKKLEICKAHLRGFEELRGPPNDPKRAPTL